MYATRLFNVWRAVVLGVPVFIAACDPRTTDACDPAMSAKLEQHYRSIEAYASLTVSDEQVLAKARALAMDAALDVTRYCLQECGSCDRVTINLPPELKSAFTAISSKLKVTRLEIGVEHDDRKTILGILDSPEYPAVAAIEVDVRRNQPAHIHMAQVMP